MQTITSTKNQYVQKAHSLLAKKFRNESGLFVVEGINLIKDMPNDVEIVYAFSTEQRLDEALSIFSNRGFLQTNLQDKDAVCVNATNFFVVTQDVMRYISDTVTPYGILAVCKIPKTEFCLPKGNALLLDGVSDPGNMGTILRSAAACNFCEIYLLNCVDLYSPKVVRATLGGLFKVKAIEVDEQQALYLVDKTNSAVLDMGGKNILADKVQSPLLFVAGNEAHGVKDIFKEHCKTAYSLPMQNGIESLNVAVATSVAMYQTI